MSRTKLALDVVQDLRSLADSIETLANAALGDDAYDDLPSDASTPQSPTNAQEAAKQPAGQTAQPNAQSTAQAATQPKQPESGQVTGQSQKAPAKAVAPAQTQAPSPDQPPKPLSMVELRAYVSSRTTSENRGTIRSILTKHGVNKLTELPEDQYEVIWNEVAAL